MRNTIITYSLHYLESVGTYLPAAYFVEEEAEVLGYMIARAVPENVESYGIPVQGTPHEQLLDVCHQLTVGELETKYNARTRKNIPLDQLFEHPKVGPVLGQFIQRKMQSFLALISESQLPLCLEIERKASLEQIRIAYPDAKMTPDLSFKKTEDGIEYRLALRVKEDVLIPREHDVHIVLDKPGYLLIHYQLYKLEHVNGKKLKPFLKKSEIFIPQRMTKTYFEKFIMDVINKVDINAEGFEVEQSNRIIKVETSFTEDFIENRYVLDLMFYYEETFFYGSDPTTRRNRLILDEDGNVTIRQVTRSDQEGKYFSKLQAEGLHRNEARRFVLEGQEGKYDVIQWVIDNRSFFKKNGIAINGPTIDGKNVQLDKAEIYLDTTVENDWFDIKGSIVIGEFTIYFSDLMESIRHDDPIYILPNGEVFIIPDSWMSKYQALAKFGKKNGNEIRINKSQYTLIEETEELSGGMRMVVVDETEIDYEKDTNLKAELRPYQLEGVRWLLKHRANGLGACLADDMGLGKTLQTLAVLSYTKEHLKAENAEPEKASQMTLFQQEILDEIKPLWALILLPASLVFNWIEEVKKFCPHFLTCAYIGPGRDAKRNQLNQFDIVFTTYQTALRDIEILQKTHWEYIVLDESHMIKNKDSKIFKAVNTLDSNNKISLSGTPIENSLADLWSQMQFINPDLLGNFAFFKEHFLTPIQRHRNEAVLDELKKLVSPFILRRRKEEVAKDLPEISEQVELVPMSKQQAKLFEEEKSTARNELLSMSTQSPEFTFHVFRSLLRLRQIANHPVLLDEDYEHNSGKFDQVIDHLESILKSGHKVLVFSSFTGHLDLFAKALEEREVKYCQLTGKTPQKQRKLQVERFQNHPEYPVFLISLKAGGVGLNLTRADYVFILDPWWNPFVERQAIARAHRIGREHPISVIRFISKDSIEEKIMKLQARKRVLAAELIEDQEQVDLAREDLQYLLG